MPGFFDNLRGSWLGSTKTKQKAELPIYTEEEVARHNTAGDIWIIVNGNVYDFTKWQYKHPGGRHPILEWAGRDATSAFQSAHRRDQPKPKDMIGRLASKGVEVEADRKGSFLKKSFEHGMDQDQRAQEITQGKKIGFAPLGQGPKASMAELERKKVVDNTSTLRLVVPEEENLTGKKPTRKENIAEEGKITNNG